MIKEKTPARRERLAKMRAEQKRRERRMTLIMWGAGGFVVVLLVGLAGIYLARQAAATSLADVKTYGPYKGALHVNSRVTYKETPPVGGEHNPAWQNCGAYDQPINNENGVHSMEHGAVWITYRPDLPKAQVDKLTSMVTDYVLLSPYPGLPAPVVASSWNHQLLLTGADDPRLPKYIAKYKQNPNYTPEFGAACTGGIDTTAAQHPLPTATASETPTARMSGDPTPQAPEQSK